jgi:hypothetical protein
VFAFEGSSGGIKQLVTIAVDFPDAQVHQSGHATRKASAGIVDVVAAEALAAVFLE